MAVFGVDLPRGDTAVKERMDITVYLGVQFRGWQELTLSPLFREGTYG